MPKKAITDILRHVPPLEWEDHLQGLGYIIQNEHCPQEILELVIATILYAISNCSIEEVKRPAAEALVAARVIRQEKFETLFAAINSPGPYGNEDWQGPAQIVGEMINQEGEAAKKLLSGLYYILQSDEEYFYPNLKERVAQLLGYVDSYENTRVLLETLRNKSPGRSFFKARIGAVFGLTQIGRRHPNRQAKIISVFSEVFHEAERLTELEDSLFEQKSPYELRCAIIQAIGNMPNTSSQARELLKDTIVLPSAPPSYLDKPIAVYAAEAAGKLDLEPVFSAEITDTLLLALSSSDPRVRNAAWESLNRLEQKAQEDSSPIIHS